MDFHIDAVSFTAIRKVQMLSMKQLAEALGISISYVNNIEKGHDRLTENVRRRLISKFDLTPEKVSQIRTIYETYGKQAL